MYRTYKLTWVMDTGDETDLGWTTARDEAEAYREAVKRAHREGRSDGRAVAEHKAPSLKKQQIETQLDKTSSALEECSYRLGKWLENNPGSPPERYLEDYGCLEEGHPRYLQSYRLGKWFENTPSDPPPERRRLEDYGCLLHERRLEDKLYIALRELNAAFRMVRGQGEGFEDL